MKELVEVTWSVPVGTHKEVNINPFVLKLHCMFCYSLDVDLPSESLLQEPLYFAKPDTIAIPCHCICINICGVLDVMALI